MKSMSMNQYDDYGKYLPYLSGCSKKQNFQYIKDRVWEKVQGWKEKLIS